MSGATLEDLAAEVKRLADIEEIKQLKAAYVRLVDSKQWQQWGELFTDDARLESQAGVNEGRENIVAIISGSMSDGVTIHRVMMPEITITGPDTATGTWAMLDLVQLRINGQSHNSDGWGYYEETYLRTPDGWRIRSSKQRRQRIDVKP